MNSFQADPASFHHRARIHPALTSFADEVCGTLARLIAYAIALALLGIGGVYAWHQLPDATADIPGVEADWSFASHTSRTFAVSHTDSIYKTEAYEIFRHPEGGRRDRFRWTGRDQKLVAELEIYRAGGGSSPISSVIAEIAGRMDPDGTRKLEAAGVIDSKFGPVRLLRLNGQADRADACLAFLKPFDELHLRISGWSCRGDDWPARRAATGCLLNRLTLLAAGTDRKMAELFARAELKRADCGASDAPMLSADWVTGVENPRLRGTF